jgi:predicted enzyme related to lactoylglutathione lyase
MASRIGYTLDCCDAERLSAFWTEALGYSCRGRFGDYWPLQSRNSVDEPWFTLQQVSEPKAGKNRMHVDIHVTTDLEAEARRVEALGAHRLSAEPLVMGDHSWFVMADPEGNEFCVVRRPD